MELKDLIGLRELSGVDESTEKIKQYDDVYEDVNTVRFVIDGITYKAVEDPDDGYRSNLKELIVCDDKLTNTFPAQKVFGIMKPDSNYEDNNVIQFIDVVTNKICLEVGTENCNDYYPCCVMHWNPENLAINIGK